MRTEKLFSNMKKKELQEVLEKKGLEFKKRDTKSILIGILDSDRRFLDTIAVSVD